MYGSFVSLIDGFYSRKRTTIVINVVNNGVLLVLVTSVITEFQVAIVDTTRY